MLYTCPSRWYARCLGSARMMSLSRIVAALASASLITTLSLSAHADGTPSMPPAQPAPASAQAPNGEYIAPLHQPTQQIYVPQSVALSGPRIIKDYEEGEPVPPGYHPESRVRTGFIVGGAVTFGALYLISVLVGAAITDVNRGLGGKESGELLYVPVAGPFLQMINTESSTGNVTLAIDGAGQALGATLLIVGITSPRTVLVRNDLGQVRIMPMRMGQSGGGIGLGGTF